MKRTLFLNSIAFVCVAAGVVLGQAEGRRVCPFNIAGLWRSDTATDITRIFFNFSPEGHVTLMGYSPNTLPQDFEMITSVRYQLDKPAAPTQIDFTAKRGDDVFQKGVTSWKIIQFGDNSFTTLDPVSGQQTRWVREQTHRYFLTFAARSAPPPLGGPAFAMWTVMDGRETKVEALGIQSTHVEAGSTVPIFGPIPVELASQIIEESERDKKGGKKEDILIARFELTSEEFEITHKTYDLWEQYLKTQKLPHRDPYKNVIEFFSLAATGFSPCNDRVRMNGLARAERDAIAAQVNPPQQPFEFIRILRKKNDELHVTNSMYPWIWRPRIQYPGL